MRRWSVLSLAGERATHRPDVGTRSTEKRYCNVTSSEIVLAGGLSLSGPANSLTTVMERIKEGHHRDGPTAERFSQDPRTSPPASRFTSGEISADDDECSKTKADKDLGVIDRTV